MLPSGLTASFCKYQSQALGEQAGREQAAALIVRTRECYQLHPYTGHFAFFTFSSQCVVAVTGGKVWVLERIGQVTVR